MINAVHLILNSADPAADRAFLRDVVGWPSVEDTDSEPGWLIFKLPPAELGVHPGGTPAQELYLMCDDLESTMAELTAKGVEFTAPVTEEPWGRLTRFRLPGGGELPLYQPTHALAYTL